MQEQLSAPLDLVNTAYQFLTEQAITWSFKLFGAALVVLAGFMVARWMSRLLLGILEKRDVDVTLRQFMASTVRLLILIMFIIVALGQLDISITPLIAAIGGLAVGLSLALQGPVSNYGAGLMIILTRMYRVGDTITTQGCSGLVEDISLAATSLRAEDGELIIIPNKHIVGEVHTNSEANRIVEGCIGIAYSADPELAIKAIHTVLEAQSSVVKEAAPEVGICNFGDSSIDIEYRYWTPTGGYFKTIHTVNLAIFRAFAEQRINIPFPQSEVRLLNNDAG
ncbi:MAG: mechanosensitive ion channel family protein [bacterium]